MNPISAQTGRNPTVLVVHGFAVKSIVFNPLLSRLKKRSFDAALFRYPSIALPLVEIVDRLVCRLREDAPNAIIAHSLGCMATALAIEKTGWKGAVVMMAPPFATLPATRLIPRYLRWPFAPLLDHRELTSTFGYKPPTLAGCLVKSVVGRFDGAVPLPCTHNDNIDERCIVTHTHNSMLFSSVVADLCSDWITTHGGP